MKISTIELTDTEKQALEQGYKLGETAVYRQRCHLILLKSQGYKALDIAHILDTNIQSVYNWVKRYREHGIDGLQTKPGQGRKPILTHEHEQIVKDCISQERQRVKLIMDELTEQTGKQFSQRTLERFLKVLATPTNVSECD